jgi:hypothetical protein
VNAVLVLESYLYYALGIVAAGIELWALADCLRRSPRDFERSLKRTKTFWLAVTGGAFAVGLLSVAYYRGGTAGIFQLVAVIAASVYLADVRPAVGSARSSKPYRPW